MPQDGRASMQGRIALWIIITRDRLKRALLWTTASTRRLTICSWPVPSVGTMMCVVLLIAMLAGFFAHGGLLGGILVFVILNAAGFYLLR